MRTRNNRMVICPKIILLNEVFAHKLASRYYERYTYVLYLKFARPQPFLLAKRKPRIWVLASPFYIFMTAVNTNQLPLEYCI